MMKREKNCIPMNISPSNRYLPVCSYGAFIRNLVLLAVVWPQLVQSAPTVATSAAPTGAVAVAKAPEATAALEPNFLFSDNMVLQREKVTPIWGRAVPGETVKVSFRDKSASAVADNDGKWMVKMGPFAPGGPFEMTIEAKSGSRTIKNVLVGDVWFCAGQSNMWWSVMKAKDGKAEAAKANYPQIRLITIPQRGAKVPQDTLNGPVWSECNPETIQEFSAVAYYFGRGLHEKLKVPIALINSSWGGSMAQSWTSLEGLETNPDLVAHAKDYYGTVKKFEDEFSKGIVDEDGAYIDPGVQPNEKGWESATLDEKDWQSMDLPKQFNYYGKPLYTQGAVWFRKTVEVPEGWAGKELELGLGSINNYDVTFFNGREIGRSDRASFAAKTTPGSRDYKVPGELVKAGSNVIAVRVFNSSGGGGIMGFTGWQRKGDPMTLRINPKESLSLVGPWKYKVSVPLPQKVICGFTKTHHMPSCLFNGMVSPVIPSAFRGVIWYQGENNIHNAWEYRALFPALIRSWRTAWGQGDFPFIYVQLPNLTAPAKTPIDDSAQMDSWNELRDAQRMALSEPNTAMVVAIDIGDAGAIHPPNKQDVGARLGLAAQALAYGEKIEYSGPLYKSMKIEGSKIRISFTHQGGGLVAKGSETGELKRFAVAGADKKYVWAQAKIDGDSVVVWSDEVPNPIAVSYAWAMNPEGCNLYNKEGLPASPFRTDDWPMKTTGRKAPY